MGRTVRTPDIRHFTSGNDVTEIFSIFGQKSDQINRFSQGFCPYAR